MARIVRTLLASGATAALIAGASGCSCSVGGSSAHAVSKKDVAGQVINKMTDSDGNKPSSVSCPEDLPAKVGAHIDCEMKVKGDTYNVNVTVTSVEGKDVKFDMVVTVDKNDVARTIGQKLSDQIGSDPNAVTCPDNLKGFVGATLRCVLTDDGKKYAINVTVTSVNGSQVNYRYSKEDQPE